MNCIINSAIALLKGSAAEANCVQSGAITIAVVAFVLGMVVALVLRKVCCPCKCAKKSAPAPKKAKSEPKFEKTHPAPADGSIEIYVGNLSYDLTEDLLRKEFEAYGKVNSCRIITNKYNGKSKGFGFVHMPNQDEVNAAIAALSEKEILGRRLKCNQAKNVMD